MVFIGVPDTSESDIIDCSIRDLKRSIQRHMEWNGNDLISALMCCAVGSLNMYPNTLCVEKREEIEVMV